MKWQDVPFYMCMGVERNKDYVYALPVCSTSISS